MHSIPLLLEKLAVTHWHALGFILCIDSEKCVGATQSCKKLSDVAT